MSGSEEVVRVQSMYGGNTRQPAVQITIGDRKPVQWLPHEARQIAAQLIECAEAAEQDAFLVEWGTAALGDERSAAALLMEYRKWREAR